MCAKICLGAVTPCELHVGTANALAIRFKRRPASPPIGGYTWQDGNQELLLDDADVSGPDMALVQQRVSDILAERAAKRPRLADGEAAERARSRERRDSKRKRRSDSTRAEQAEATRDRRSRHSPSRQAKRRRRPSSPTAHDSGTSSASPPTGGQAAHAEDRRGNAARQEVRSRSPVKGDRQRSSTKDHRKRGRRRQPSSRNAELPRSHHADGNDEQRAKAAHGELHGALRTLIESGYDVEDLLRADRHPT